MLMGHVGVSWDLGNEEGYGPVVAGISGKAKLGHDSDKANGMKRIKTTAAQDADGKAYAAQYLSAHPEYYVLGSNCVDFAAGVMNAEHISATPIPFNDMTPASFYEKSPGIEIINPHYSIMQKFKSLIGQ